MTAASHTKHSSVASTLQYNADAYRNHYANPLLELRYDCLYRAKRVARMLADAGIDPSKPGFAACEYGFGAGHNLRVVAQADSVVGLEASPSAVARARAMASKAGYRGWELIEHGDAAQLPLDSERFDLMSASHVLEHIDDDDVVIDEWIRVVKPGGHLLILLPSNETLFPGSKHLRTYDVDAFCQRLTDKGLVKVTVDEHQRFDRPFKDHRLILASRRTKALKMLVEGPKVALFLPSALLGWRLLAAFDDALGELGAKSSSIAYLFEKPGK